MAVIAKGHRINENNADTNGNLQKDDNINSLVEIESLFTHLMSIFVTFSLTSLKYGYTNLWNCVFLIQNHSIALPHIN